MTRWAFFPSETSVLAVEERSFFVPLATTELNNFVPGTTGPVHFLRPRMIDDGDETAIQEGDSPYPIGWYAFRRDDAGRYKSVLPLTGTPVRELGDPYTTLHTGNSRDRFFRKEIEEKDLLSYSNFSGEWPNANWNYGQSAYELTARELKFVGELDTVNFCSEGCAGSVILYDANADIIIQVFHWT